MNSVQTLPPTLPPNGLKSAFSILDQEMHDELLQDSLPTTPTFEYPSDHRHDEDEVASRGRDTTPKAVHGSLSPFGEASPKSPTEVFSELREDIRNDLAKNSRPSSPVDRGSGPDRIASTASGGLSRDRAPAPILVDSPLGNEHSQKSPTAIFARLDGGLRDELAQDSGPATPAEHSDPFVESVTSYAPKSAAVHQRPAESELASKSIQSPLSATFSKLNPSLYDDLEQSSAPISPRDEPHDPLELRRHSIAPDRKPGSPINVEHFNSLASPLSATFSKLGADVHDDLAEESEPCTPNHETSDVLSAIRAPAALPLNNDASPHADRSDSAQSPLSASLAKLPTNLKEDLAQTSAPRSPAPEPSNQAPVVPEDTASPLSATFAKLPSTLHEELTRSSTPSHPTTNLPRPIPATEPLPSIETLGLDVPANQKYERANIVLTLLSSPSPSSATLVEQAELSLPASFFGGPRSLFYSGSEAICAALTSLQESRPGLKFESRLTLAEYDDLGIFGYCSWEESSLPFAAWAHVDGEGKIWDIKMFAG